jgi:hypothetical protein
MDKFQKKVVDELTFQLKERAVKEACGDVDIIEDIFESMAEEFATDIVQQWYSSKAK